MYIYITCRPGGPHWEKLCQSSQLRCFGVQYRWVFLGVVLYFSYQFRMTDKWNATMNGIQLTQFSCSTLGNDTAERIAKTFAYCLILVTSLTENTLIENNCLQHQRNAKNSRLFNRENGHSDVFPIFAFPLILAELNYASADYWCSWQDHA